jgi:hypothetical protein
LALHPEFNVKVPAVTAAAVPGLYTYTFPELRKSK